MSTGGGRLHHLDALRALAMLLGIALHASFRSRPQTGTGADVLRWLVDVIHSFRMPLFFLMAGIFAALLVERRGAAGFVANRAERIAVPLGIGLLALVPLQELLAASERGQAVHYTFGGPGHLWFLEFLLVFYLAALALRRVRAVKELTRAMRARVVGALLGGRVPGLRLALVTAAILVVAGGWGHTPSTHYLPDPRQLAYYGVFFGLGWLLFSDLRPLRALERRPMVYTLVALGLSVPLFFAEKAYFGDGSRVPYLVLGSIVGVAAITALYGFTVRVCSRPRPIIRYIVDASYWMYLMHILALWPVDNALQPLGLAWWAHYPALCAITSGLLLVTYALFVRYSIIGRVLHGRRERPESVPGRSWRRARSLLRPPRLGEGGAPVP